MAQLGSCDYYGIPHEYSAMTCKHWHPAAPAPQAERCPKCGSRVRSAYGQIMEPLHGAGTWPKNCDDPWHMGAAPAETAQHERTDENGGKHYPGETAGEMTVEQFWPEWTQAQGIGTPNHPLISRKTMFEFADAHAKQRVEQAQLENGNAVAREIFKLATKVADLERERDTLLIALGCQLGGVKSALQVIEAKNEFIESAESELREMREVLGNVLKYESSVATIWGPCEKAAERAEFVKSALALLARKAGS